MKLAAFSLGAIALAAQVVLFREALVRAGGDELVLGALLGAWLAAGALGALLARWPRRRTGLSSGLGALLLALSLVGGVLAWRGAPGLAGTGPGERQGAFLFAAQAFLWNGPAALLCGWLFARLDRREGGREAPSLVSFEALGAALAGVLLALPPVLAWIPSGAALESRHGRYEVVEREGERWLRHDGRELWALEAKLPREGRRALEGLLLEVPSGARVLLAADPDFLPAVLAQGPAEVDLLLADPGLAGILRRHAGSALARALQDDRVRLRFGGARRWLDGGRQYEAIWLGAADPDRAGPAQLVSVEGLERIAAALSPAGLVGLRLGAVDGVSGSLGMQRASLVAAGMAEAGLEPVLLGDGTLLGAKRGAGSSGVWRLAPAELAARAAERGLGDPLDREAAWGGLFAPATLELWNRSLRSSGELPDSLGILLAAASARPAEWPAFEPGAGHTDLRPLARSLSARIAEGHARGGRPGLLAGILGVGVVGQGLAVLLFLAALSLAAGRGRPRGARVDALCLSTTSFAATVGFLVVLEHYQARTGTLQADLGWLGGAFLLGFALGSRISPQLRGGLVDRVTIGSLALVLGWILLPPGGAAGAVAGAAACALSLGGAAGAAVGEGARSRGLGWAWALDLAAAAPGALLAGVALLSTAGWPGCLALLLGLQVVSLAARKLQSPAARGTTAGEGDIGSRDPQAP